MPAPRDVAHIEVIEGRRTLVAPNASGLPPRLDTLFGQLLDLTYSVDITPAGTRVACEVLREHRFRLIRQGRWRSPSAFLDVRVLMCADCGAVCVRDVSLDRMAGLPVGRRGPARRDMVLGWYSGKRRAGREYR